MIILTLSKAKGKNLFLLPYSGQAQVIEITESLRSSQ
jgi:hypothetical protein